VTPLQIEDLPGAFIAMEADPASTRCHVQGELGPVIVGFVGRNYGRIGDVPLGDPSDRIAHEAQSGGKLGLVFNVLELAAATLIADVVGTAGLDPLGRALQQAFEPSPGEPLVLPKAGELNQISRSGPGHEDRLPARQSGDSIPAGGQAEDAYGHHRSPSLRPCLAHSPGEPASVVTTGRRP
jgi:hypothetical protein